MNDDTSRRRQHCIDLVDTRGRDWLDTSHAPAPGSPLAGDDRVTPRTSTIATRSIVSAIDHLGFVTDAMKSDGPLRHYAPQTVLRTALLSACHAVWILEPASRTERRTRTLRLAHTNADQQRKAAEEMDVGDLGAEARTALQKTVESLRSECDDIVKTATTENLGVVAADPNNADIIRDCVRGIGTGDHFLQMGLRALWRTGSAAAHGYYWTDRLSSNPQARNDEAFNNALYGATLMVVQAMDLYDTKATAHI